MILTLPSCPKVKYWSSDFCPDPVGIISTGSFSKTRLNLSHISTKPPIGTGTPSKMCLCGLATVRELNRSTESV